MFGGSMREQAEIRLPNMPTGISDPHELEYRSPSLVVRQVKTAPPIRVRRRAPTATVQPRRVQPRAAPKPAAPKPEPFKPPKQESDNDPVIKTPTLPPLPVFKPSSGRGRTRPE